MEYIEIKSNKEYLVDVPVRLTIWIRPECQRIQFDVIKMARPSILFIQSDGGRNSKEQELIEQNRKIFDEEIDWHCHVYRFYENVNLGMYEMSTRVINYLFSVVDRCIFLEDDQIPSVSYFKYSADLLEKYKDDERIECVCGMNYLGEYGDFESDYFFSRQGDIWGVAYWKRVWKDWHNFEYYNNKYIMKVLKERTKHNEIIWKRLNAYGKGEKYEGHIAGTEFWIEFDMYYKNRVQIVPKYNLISNIGATADSTHFEEYNVLPSRLKKIFNMKTYEINSNLNHPKYVMPDVYYEKERNKRLGYNSKNYFRMFYEKCEVIFLKIYYRMKLLIQRRTTNE